MQYNYVITNDYAFSDLLQLNSFVAFFSFHNYLLDSIVSRYKHCSGLFTCVINKVIALKIHFCSFNQPALMRKVILVFPNITSIAEFLLTNKVSKTIIDSSQKTLKGMMSDKVLDVAVKQFGAKIKESIAVKSFGV